MSETEEVAVRESHRLVVDRFEGDLAVVEVDGVRFLDLPRWVLPPAVREGDIVAVTRAAREESAGLELSIDREATARAREEAREIIEELRRKDPGGDVVL